MAESPITLPELVTINDRNLQDVDIPNFFDNSPFMRTNFAQIASHDTIHKWLIYQPPPVGFRDPNNGREVQSSTDTYQDTNCKILDASMRTDLALAQSYRRGGASGWMNREAGRHLSAAFYKAEVQIFQGRGTGESGTTPGISDGPGTGQGDDTGFDGLPNYVTMSHLNGGMVVDGGGTAERQSAYLIRSGPADVGIITGRSGDVAIGDTNVQETAGAIGTYPALYTPITAWYALMVGSTVTSAVRIANIGTDSNVNDALFYDAISKFGTGRQPTHIYMSRRVLEQLRSSRTATNGTGAPAPRPTEIEGIPIVPTDGLFGTEAAVTTSP